MAPRTRWMVFLVSTPLVMLVTVGGLIGPPKAAAQQSLPELRILGDVVGLINNAYVEPVDIDKVMDGAMRGLAEGLDPSSAFLVPEEVRAIETRAPLPAGDVGLMVERQFYLRVMGVRDGSPAARAGLQSGDYIRMIDAKPTRDMSAFTGRRLLRGAPGTKVSLTIIRGNTADPHTFELAREAPSGPSATSRMIGDVAHVRISTFDSTVPATLQTVFKTLERLQGRRRGDRPPRHRRQRPGGGHRRGASVRQVRHHCRPRDAEGRARENRSGRGRRGHHDAGGPAGLERHGQCRRGLCGGSAWQQARGPRRRAHGWPGRCAAPRQTAPGLWPVADLGACT